MLYVAPDGILLSERLDRVCLRAMLSPEPGKSASELSEGRRFLIASNGTENPYAGCARSFARISATATERQS